MKINSVFIKSEPVTVFINGQEHTIDYSRFFDAINDLTGQGPCAEDKQFRLAARRKSFVQFWDMYGKKNKKEETWKLWGKLKEHEIKEIFETLPLFLKNNPDLKFRPLPPTYIRGKRWEDELEPQKKQSALPSFATPNVFR